MNAMHGTTTIVLLLLLLLAPAGSVPQPRAAGSSGGGGAPAAAAWQFLPSYPRQLITYRLQPSEHIEIDGKLDEPAWEAVNWTEPMEDIAQSFYPNLTIPDGYATKMKVRYDHDHLYVAAQYYQSFTWATVTGHNDELTAGLAPYSNDDFEVRIHTKKKHRAHRAL
jgi:hypothetical protein